MKEWRLEYFLKSNMTSPYKARPTHMGVFDGWSSNMRRLCIFHFQKHGSVMEACKKRDVFKLEIKTYDRQGHWLISTILLKRLCFHLKTLIVLKLVPFFDVKRDGWGQVKRFPFIIPLILVRTFSLSLSLYDFFNKTN
jgi:hypothetical protein